LLLLVYPTLMLAVKGGMNGSFLLMLLLTFAVWIVRPAGLNAVKWQHEWNAYLWPWSQCQPLFSLAKATITTMTASHDAASATGWRSRYFCYCSAFA